METFPETYGEARRAFRDRAEARGWSLGAWPTGDLGPDGESLTVDVAISPAPDARRVLVVSSGLHGVEAPLGSVVQRTCLDGWADLVREPGVRCVLIHALNPYGFAWSRRTDAGNVDPNRNFWDQRPAGAAPDTYAIFNPLLNPARPPTRFDLFVPRAIAAAVAYGPARLRRALVSGQSDYPKGLFFGGTSAGACRTVLERELKHWVGGAERVIHLDIHTGLGRWATGKLLVDYPMSAEVRAWAQRAFPTEIEDVTAGGSGYRAVGSLAQWCVSRALAPLFFFAFAEFGTYGGITVLSGLRRENQAHYWTPPGDRRVAQAKARLRELFCPASPEWRSRVVAQSHALISAACQALADG
jgi:hypothetical protein